MDAVRIKPALSVRGSLSGMLCVLLIAGTGCRTGSRQLVIPFQRSEAEISIPAQAETTLTVDTTESTIYAVAEDSHWQPVAHSEPWTPFPTPAAPHELTKDEYPEMYLTLEECIAIALQKNRYIHVERYSPPIADREIIIQDSYFHPLFQLGAEYSETRSQIANVVDGPGLGVSTSKNLFVGPPQGMTDQLRLSQRTSTGGEVSGSLSTFYDFTDPGGSFLNINPAFRSRAEVEVSHPFLRGAGRDIAMTQVYVASDLSMAARCELEVAVTKTANQTASIYWELFEKRAILESRKQGVREATNALRRELERLELGASSQPEVGAVREQLERFRVNLTLAEGEVADRERRLRTVLGIPRESGTALIPTTIPFLQPPQLDWDEAIDHMECRRAEIRVQRWKVQAATRKEIQAENFILPDIGGYAGYGLSGVADNFGESWQAVSSGQYGYWWAGVLYQKQFGRCHDKATLSKRQLELAQQRAALEQARDLVLDELHAAHQETENAWRGILMTTAQKIAANKVLSARREMHQLGEIDVQDYLMALTIWNQAVTDQQSAIARYNAALMNWEFARGRLLQFRDSQLDPLSPPISADDAGRMPVDAIR